MTSALFTVHYDGSRLGRSLLRLCFVLFFLLLIAGVNGVDGVSDACIRSITK